MKKENFDEIIVKNKNIRDIFLGKIFEKKKLKKYLEYMGFAPKRLLFSVTGLMISLPFLSHKIFELFPNHTTMGSWIFGIIGVGIAIFYAAMFCIYEQTKLENITGREMKKDDKDSLEAFIITSSLVLYGGSNIVFMNYGLNALVVIGFCLYSLIPISYLYQYVKTNINYFKKENDVPENRDLSIRHEDNVEISKLLSKEEMSIFLDLYKKYDDIPYDKITKLTNENKQKDNKEEYLESLYSSEK